MSGRSGDEGGKGDGGGTGGSMPPALSRRV